MEDDNPDFVTIMPAAHGQACVAIMHWRGDEYVIKRVSQALPVNAANHLAESWAAIDKLQIR